MTHDLYRPEGFEHARSIEEEARLWLIEIYAQSLTQDVQAGFRDWLSRSPDHSAAYARLERSWRDLVLIEGLEDLTSHRRVGLGARLKRVWGERPMSSWNVTAGLAGALALVCLTALVGISMITASRSVIDSPRTYIAYQTAMGQSRSVTLEDGSIITLGAATHLDVHLGVESRDLILHEGQAYFDVARDEARPFKVDAGSAQIRVLGTEFDIRRAPRGVEVIVAEGEVGVHSVHDPRGDFTPENPLRAGQQVRIAPGEPVSQVMEANLETAFDWREGRLSYADAPLEDVIADLNRYRAVPIILSGRELRDIRVTTAFDIARQDQFLAMVIRSYNLKQTITPDRILLYREVARN
ncbi:FecR family protein [Woodsholea maritima]|uniref:FecR family protein n=1 Tax=Woodsholea maritima TaxID=240237 RepID=UPI0003A93A41|nr:FecR domain-containing protein [Woodsholea maritima]